MWAYQSSAQNPSLAANFKLKIDDKILLLTYKALKGLAPEYLSELLIPYSPPRLIRSQDAGNLKIPRISQKLQGEEEPSLIELLFWNNLPRHIRASDTL